MPIKFTDDGQATISCGGDVYVSIFSPKNDGFNGVAWMLLQEREQGEIGRLIPSAGGVMCLNEQPGVFIAANDPRSLTVIIDALTSLRDDLVEIQEEE